MFADAIIDTYGLLRVFGSRNMEEMVRHVFFVQENINRIRFANLSARRAMEEAVRKTLRDWYEIHSAPAAADEK